MNIGARESPCGRRAIMLELWRRVVIVSAVAVYIAGLACAGSLLVGRIEAGAGLLRGSPIARRFPSGRARTGRRDGEPVMRADDFIAVPASDAGPAGGCQARSRPRDPAGRSAASHPGRQHLPPRLRRVLRQLGCTSAHGLSAAGQTRFGEPRAAVACRRSPVCMRTAPAIRGWRQIRHVDPARARASAARRDAEHLVESS
jgi:hypothetical protein